jgi:predicted nucleic acid-binding protein
MVGEGDGFWSSYRRIADVVKPKGNLVPDAHLVALMHQHGISTIWSHDRDFRKFEGITVRDPFAG